MRIYIVGSVASGKTTLAKAISKKTGVPYHSLDEVVHIRDKTKNSGNAVGNSKRTVEQRDFIFNEIINSDEYIIEDTGRKYFESGMAKADQIVLLEPPILVRNYRIIKRYIRQKLGIEQCGYIPSIKMCRLMFKWAKAYETGADGVKSQVNKYHEKVVILRTNKDVECYVDNKSHHIYSNKNVVIP